jgi:hypothetical protein
MASTPSTTNELCKEFTSSQLTQYVKPIKKANSKLTPSEVEFEIAQLEKRCVWLVSGRPITSLIEDSVTL